LAGGGLAANRKKIREEKARLVLIDESGLLLSPLVRRSLAPRGRTPILKRKTTHRDRISLIAGLSISPVRHRLGLHFRTHPKEYVNGPQAADFVRQLLRSLRGPVMVLWDGGTMHKGEAIRQLQQDFPRLSLERLPPYAPELNPVEMLWKHLKYDALVNYAPEGIADLHTAALAALQAAQASPERLAEFFRVSSLPPLDTVLAA
jgi:transposase